MKREIIDGPFSYRKIDSDLLQTLQPPSKNYWRLLSLLGFLIFLAAFSWGVQIFYGMGMSGKNSPVGWALYITSFVFWVGIAHSGTLISAILFLFRVKWRAPIYRSAEAVTVFALMVAGMFLLIHLGRPWVFFWVFPVAQMGDMWPNFRSPILWDFFAVFTYLIVSSVFFYLGMIPDLAILRDRVHGWRKKIYRVLAIGWQGSNTQWRHYRAAYTFLAALATPLVISVHSIVSWDFAMSIVPGWHATIFAPYFVAGAIHSGLAMVIVLLIPMRKWFRIEHFIRIHHVEQMAKLMIITALLVGFAYIVEIFIAWYSGHAYERDVFAWRAFGTYWWAFWSLFVFNLLLPMLFWWKKIRTNTRWIFPVAIGVIIGMWLERFVIIVGSLSHDYNPFAWGLFHLTWVEVFIILGGFSLFIFLFLVFTKTLPVVSNWEVKEQMQNGNTKTQ